VARLHSGASWLNSVFTFPAFFSPVWFAAMYRAAARADLIIVRDLPLAPLALFVARARGIPVVLDMAECYPEMLRAQWTYGHVSLVDVFVRNPRLAAIVERVTTRRVDHIFAMVEESRDRLKALGVPAERITIVSNTPQLSFWPPPPPHPGKLDRLHLVYLGLLGPTRGLVELIEGIATFAAEFPGVHLTVYGTGRLGQRLRETVDRLDAGAVVTLFGRLPGADVAAALAAADVGVIPHRRCGHWNHTVSNKLFDYMASGLPVLATDAAPTQRIVEATGSGVIWRDGDRESLLASLRALTDPADRARMGANGRRAVEDKFNWSRDAATLRQVIRGLNGSSGR
jgi:glycosyltransferase involved in cell wall biosynthesis